MTSSPKKVKILLLPQKKNKYATSTNYDATKAIMKIEYFKPNEWFAPPYASYIRGACDPVCFISRAQYPDPKLF